MARYGGGDDTLCGPFLSEVMAGALRMGECNACMGRIVAAPTAGACGVLPAVLLPYARRFGAEEQIVVIRSEEDRDRTQANIRREVGKLYGGKL